jgi:hypothetical protein
LRSDCAWSEPSFIAMATKIPRTQIAGCSNG